MDLRNKFAQTLLDLAILHSQDGRNRVIRDLGPEYVNSIRESNVGAIHARYIVDRCAESPNGIRILIDILASYEKTTRAYKHVVQVGILTELVELLNVEMGEARTEQFLRHQMVDLGISASGGSVELLVSDFWRREDAYDSVKKLIDQSLVIATPTRQELANLQKWVRSNKVQNILIDSSNSPVPDVTYASRRPGTLVNKDALRQQKLKRVSTPYVASERSENRAFQVLTLLIMIATFYISADQTQIQLRNVLTAFFVLLLSGVLWRAYKGTRTRESFARIFKALLVTGLWAFLIILGVLAAPTREVSIKSPSMLRDDPTAPKVYLRMKATFVCDEGSFNGEACAVDNFAFLAPQPKVYFDWIYPEMSEESTLEILYYFNSTLVAHSQTPVADFLRSTEKGIVYLAITPAILWGTPMRENLPNGVYTIEFSIDGSITDTAHFVIAETLPTFPEQSGIRSTAPIFAYHDYINRSRWQQAFDTLTPGLQNIRCIPASSQNTTCSKNEIEIWGSSNYNEAVDTVVRMETIRNIREIDSETVEFVATGYRVRNTALTDQLFEANLYCIKRIDGEWKLHRTALSTSNDYDCS